MANNSTTELQKGFIFVVSELTHLQAYMWYKVKTIRTLETDQNKKNKIKKVPEHVPGIPFLRPKILLDGGAFRKGTRWKNSEVEESADGKVSTLLAPSYGRYAQRVKRQPITNRHICRYPEFFFFFWDILSTRCAIENFPCLRNVRLLFPDKKTIASNDGCTALSKLSFRSNLFSHRFCVCTSLRSITYPGGDAIRFLSQDIEMPLNQNKSFTPGGKKGKPQTLGVVQCPLMAVIAGL